MSAPDSIQAELMQTLAREGVNDLLLETFLSLGETLVLHCGHISEEFRFLNGH